MNKCIVSVIIPAYNGSDHVGEAIQSVLDQTFKDFELILVDDASTDRTVDVVSEFPDPRIHLIRHIENKGANVARNTGLKAANGEIIAFLDQDDLYHSDKLMAHVDLLAKHPEIGFTYNSRFELNHSSRTIREIWQPPANVELADLILGFPMSPSDMVIRREWLTQGNYWEEIRYFNGGEIVLTGRLYMSGCRFASIPRALNYRRYQSGRTFNDLEIKCHAEMESQIKIFADPRCPAEIKTLENQAFTNSYMIWAYVALAQGETALGQKFIRESVRSCPELFVGHPNYLVDLFINNSIADDSKSHEALLHKLFQQIPPELNYISEQLDYSVGRGYLFRAARALIWDRPSDAREYFSSAKKIQAIVDEQFIGSINHQLLAYENEFGSQATQEKINQFEPYLEELGGVRSVRFLHGCYSINRAFQCYHSGDYSSARKLILHAIANEPRYAVNRGALAVLVKSTVGKEKRW